MRTDVIILRSLKFTISHISTHCILHKFYDTVYTWKLLYSTLHIRYKLNNYKNISITIYIQFCIDKIAISHTVENRYITSNQETIRHRFCNHRLLWVNTVTMVVHTSDPSSTLFRSSDTLRETENWTATQSILWHTTVSGWRAALTFPRPSKSIRYQIRNKSNH